MYIDPDTYMFMMILFIGTAGAYVVGYAMDGVLGEDGFGILMNTTILIAGGFLGFYLANHLHLPISDTTLNAVMVVSGGFICLALLAILKGLAGRFGY